MEEEDLEWDQLECGYLYVSLFFKKTNRFCVYMYVCISLSESWLAVQYRVVDGKGIMLVVSVLLQHSYVLLS